MGPIGPETRLMAVANAEEMEIKKRAPWEKRPFEVWALICQGRRCQIIKFCPNMTCEVSN